MSFLMETETEEKRLICDYEDNDTSKIYCGYDVKINDFITIRQPSVREIIEYGDNKYYSMVHTLCSVGADLKWQLDDMGIDYTKIEDFELFYSILAMRFSVKETRILFGDKIDFSKMLVMYNKELDEHVMIQKFEDGSFVQIDRYVYSCIMNILRKIHKMKRNDEIPANETTRKILIEDARDEYEMNKSKKTKSYLLPLLSTVVSTNGGNRKYVLDLNIYAFMDCVARFGKIKNADLLLSSGYSGFGIDLKKIDKEETNWMGDLD
nr:MAG TPA: hypothetical protein [Caudoviricetes sp.]